MSSHTRVINAHSITYSHMDYSPYVTIAGHSTSVNYAALAIPNYIIPSHGHNALNDNVCTYSALFKSSEHMPCPHMLIVVAVDKVVPDKASGVPSWRLGLEGKGRGAINMESILTLDVLDINALVRCIRMANVPRSIVELGSKFTFNSTSTDPNEVCKWATLVEKSCDYKVTFGGADDIVYASITPGTIIEGMSEEDSVRSLIPSWLL